MKSDTVTKYVEYLKTEAELLVIGTSVDLVDEHGERHVALVTEVHGPQCINAVWVSSDPAKRDPYGLQLERGSSIQKKFEGVTAQNGRYYQHFE